MHGVRDPSCEELLERLRKIEGQVRGVQHMVERRDRCIDVLTQVAAVRAALAAVGLGLVDAELRRSLSAAGVKSDAAADQTMAAVQLLVR